jgi:hypothetical protein
MHTSVTRQDSDGPFSWHHFSDLDEALEAARAADLLGIPFVLYPRERSIEDDTSEVEYVVVLMAPGSDCDPFPDDEDTEDDEG